LFKISLSSTEYLCPPVRCPLFALLFKDDSSLCIGFQSWSFKKGAYLSAKNTITIMAIIAIIFFIMLNMKRMNHPPILLIKIIVCLIKFIIRLYVYLYFNYRPMYRSEERRVGKE